MAKKGKKGKKRQNKAPVSSILAENDSLNNGNVAESITSQQMPNEDHDNSTPETGEKSLEISSPSDERNESNVDSDNDNDSDNEKDSNVNDTVEEVVEVKVGGTDHSKEDTHEHANNRHSIAESFDIDDLYSESEQSNINDSSKEQKQHSLEIQLEPAVSATPIGSPSIKSLDIFPVTDHIPIESDTITPIQEIDNSNDEEVDNKAAKESLKSGETASDAVADTGIQFTTTVESVSHKSKSIISENENPATTNIPSLVTNESAASTIDETFQADSSMVQPNPTCPNPDFPSDTSFSEQQLTPLYKYIRQSKQIQPTDFVFSLCVVDFDHVKGPEIEYWLDNEIFQLPEKDRECNMDASINKYSKLWPHLPFEALPDGAHLYDETFTQFTLNYDTKALNTELPIEKMSNVEDPLVTELDSRPIVTIEDPFESVTTLFGSGCIRQLETSELNIKSDNIKRSIIQKSVVLISRAPLPIQLKEKLSVVTQCWFEQYDFQDKMVLDSLWSHINQVYNQNYKIEADDLYDAAQESNMKIIKESDIYIGLNFQEVVQNLKRNLLVLFKALILGNSKILVFSKNLNALSNTQYCLIGLIPAMLLHLTESGSPMLDHASVNLKKVSSLQSSNRESILNFLGLPLLTFGQGGFFQPYMTLQQLDYINNANSDNFVIGSSNDIILQHKEWFDIIIYLDEKQTGLFSNGACKIEILNSTLKECLSLTSEDKFFIDDIINKVSNHEKEESDLDSHTESRSNSGRKTSRTVNSNPSIENGVYLGGDDFIRTQFEEYLIGLLSTIKYDQFLKIHEEHGNTQIIQQLGLNRFENDIDKFNYKFVESFKVQRSGIIWNKNTEDELFNFFEPKHVGKELFKKPFLNNLFGKVSVTHGAEHPTINNENQPNNIDNLDNVVDNNSPESPQKSKENSWSSFYSFFRKK